MMTDRKSGFIWQFFIGFIFLLVGSIFLADQFLEVEITRNYWPLMVVLLGVMLFIAMILAGRKGAWLAILASVITIAGGILYIHLTYNLWLTWVYAWGLLISAVGLGMLIMNIYFKRDGLRKAAGWVMGIGLILFVIFGIIFEIIMGLTDYNVNSGLFLGGGLVLLGIFVAFSGLIFSDKRKKVLKESPTETTVAIPEVGEVETVEPVETAEEIVESEPVESAEIISDSDEAETADKVEEISEVVESEPVESVDIISEAGESEALEPVDTIFEVVESEPVESAEIISDADKAETVEGISEVVESESVESADIISDADEAETIETVEDFSEVVESEPVEPVENISDADEAETVEPIEEISEAVEYEITESEDMISEEDEPNTKSDEE
jgi:hypothetical protein